jgi:hypothetical protein
LPGHRHRRLPGIKHSSGAVDGIGQQVPVGLSICVTLVLITRAISKVAMLAAMALLAKGWRIAQGMRCASPAARKAGT